MNQTPLRILMVLRAPVGGLYRHVIDLTNALSQRGHHVGLVMDASLSDKQTDQRLASLGSPPSLGVHNIPIPRLLGPSDFLAFWRIRSIAKAQNVDILHGHGAKGGFNARLARIGIKKQAAIYTPHGGVLHFAHSSPTGKLLRMVEKRLLKATDAVIFESAFAKTSFEKQIGKVPTPGPVIHNGLLPDEFTPLDPTRIEFDFAYVGELRKIKGIHILLEAIVGVSRSDGTPVNLIIAGGGPDEKAIRQQISALGLANRVQMVGVQPALSIFARGKIAIIPSLAESLPYVALEAAAAAKPLLATDVGGIKEIFGPTAKALIPAENVVALQNAMQSAIDDPEAALKEAQTRLTWIKSNFSIEKMTNSIEEIYAQALLRHTHIK